MRGFQIRIHLNDIQYSLKNLNYKQIFFNTPYGPKEKNLFILDIINNYLGTSDLNQTTQNLINLTR
jgi:hypothetical protein